MAEKRLDTDFLDRAINYAVKAHAGTERRGKGFPYIVHPMEAMEIVSTITNDQELLAAAVLHDTVEDTGVSVEDLRKEFGSRVAGIVEEESDRFTPGISAEASWHDRKQAAIERLAKASMDAKIVAMGDKLSNMRAIARDHYRMGDELWNIFHNKDKAQHEWHYRGLAQSLRELADTEAYAEFVTLLNKVFPIGRDEMAPVKIDLADYEQSGEGGTAISYNHKDGKTMIKLYNDYMPKDVPAREYGVARAIQDMGIVTPKVGRIVTDGSRTGVEFQRISPKKSFARMMSEDPGTTQDLAVRFAKIAKELHSKQCDTTFFPNIKDFFYRVVSGDKFLTESQKTVVRNFIHSVPAAQTCLHGDLHVGNVITDGTTDYLIDNADFSFGNPLFDLGQIYLTGCVIEEPMAIYLFHMTTAQLRTWWEAFVPEYFPGEDIEKINRMLDPFAALMLLFFGNRTEMTDGMLSFIKKSFGF